MEMCAHEYELTDPEMYTKSVHLKIHRKFQEIQRDKYEKKIRKWKSCIDELINHSIYFWYMEIIVLT